MATEELEDRDRCQFLGRTGERIFNRLLKLQDRVLNVEASVRFPRRIFNIVFTQYLDNWRQLYGRYVPLILRLQP